jgi:hypothetical protein
MDEIELYYKNLDPLHPDNFRSRSDRASRMVYPKNTETRLIIPSNQGGYGFSAKEIDFTHFPMLNRLIVHQTAVKGTGICEKLFSREKNEEVRDRHKCSFSTLKIALFLSVIGFLIFQVPIYSSRFDVQRTIYAGFASLGLSIFITIIIIIKTLCMRRDKSGLEEKLMDKLEDFVNEENNNTYRRMGLELKIGYKFFWLEIRKNLSK